MNRQIVSGLVDMCEQYAKPHGSVSFLDTRDYFGNNVTFVITIIEKEVIVITYCHKNKTVRVRKNDNAWSIRKHVSDPKCFMKAEEYLNKAKSKVSAKLLKG